MELYISGLARTNGPAKNTILHAWLTKENYVHDLEIETLIIYLGEELYIKIRPINAQMIKKLGNELILIAEKLSNKQIQPTERRGG